MARTRQISPTFFLDEDLAALSRDARLLFVGLWTLADKAGRLEDKPRVIWVQLFPFDPDVDVNALLSALAAGGFIQRYEVDGRRYVQIRSFERHQHFHKNETPSKLPGPPERHRATPEKVEATPEASEKDRPSSVPVPAHSGASTVQAPEEHRATRPTYGLRLTEIDIRHTEEPPFGGPRAQERAPACEAPSRELVPVLVAEVVPEPVSKARPKPKQDGGGVFEAVLSAFCETWREHYGAAYKPTPGDRSNLGRLLKGLSPAEATELPDLFRAYLADTEPFIADKQRHSLQYFCAGGGLNKYRTRARSVPRKVAEADALREHQEDVFRSVEQDLIAMGVLT